MSAQPMPVEAIERCAKPGCGYALVNGVCPVCGGRQLGSRHAEAAIAEQRTALGRCPSCGGQHVAPLPRLDARRATG